MPEDSLILAHRAYADRLAHHLGLDYSEKSLLIADDIVIAFVMDPNGEAVSKLVDGGWDQYQPREERFADRLFACFCYLLEVAHRNLGGQWSHRKRLLIFSEVGIEFPSQHILITMQDVLGVGKPSQLVNRFHSFPKDVMPSKIYRELKARVLGVPVDTVELSAKGTRRNTQTTEQQPPETKPQTLMGSLDETQSSVEPETGRELVEPPKPPTCGAAPAKIQSRINGMESAHEPKRSQITHCDVCGANGEGILISAAQMREAVFDGGFDPFAQGLMHSKLETKTDYPNWKNSVVALQIGDWALCERCYAAIRPHFSGDPEPIGINKKDLAYQTASSSSILCTKCGAQLKPDFEYCMKCGAQLREGPPYSRSIEDRETFASRETAQPVEPAVLSEAEQATALDWFTKGSMFALSDQSEKAIECYDRAIELNPQFPDAWCSKGVALGWLGRNDEAIVCMDRALSLKPSFADAWFNKGVVLSEGLGRYREASACFEEAQRLGSGRATQGLEACRKMLSEPTTAEEWVEKATGLAVASRYQEIIECCDRAIELDPTIAVAWYNKGASLGALQRYEEAIPCYDRALELNPPGGTASSSFYYKGAVLHKLKRYSEALKCFEEAQRLGDANAVTAADVCRRVLETLGLLGKEQTGIN